MSKFFSRLGEDAIHTEKIGEQNKFKRSNQVSQLSGARNKLFFESDSRQESRRMSDEPSYRRHTINQMQESNPAQKQNEFQLPPAIDSSHMGNQTRNQDLTFDFKNKFQTENQPHVKTQTMLQTLENVKTSKRNREYLQNQVGGKSPNRAKGLSRHSHRYDRCLFALCKVIYKRLKMLYEQQKQLGNLKFQSMTGQAYGVGQKLDDQFCQVMVKIIQKTKLIEREMLRALSKPEIVDQCLEPKIQLMQTVFVYFDKQAAELRIDSVDDSDSEYIQSSQQMADVFSKALVTQNSKIRKFQQLALDALSQVMIKFSQDNDESNRMEDEGMMPNLESQKFGRFDINKINQFQKRHHSDSRERNLSPSLKSKQTLVKQSNWDDRNSMGPGSGFRMLSQLSLGQNRNQSLDIHKQFNGNSSQQDQLISKYLGPKDNLILQEANESSTERDDSFSSKNNSFRNTVSQQKPDVQNKNNQQFRSSRSIQTSQAMLTSITAKNLSSHKQKLQNLYANKFNDKEQHQKYMSTFNQGQSSTKSKNQQEPNWLDGKRKSFEDLLNQSNVSKNGQISWKVSDYQQIINQNRYQNQQKQGLQFKYINRTKIPEKPIKNKVTTLKLKQNITDNNSAIKQVAINDTLPEMKESIKESTKHYLNLQIMAQNENSDQEPTIRSRNDQIQNMPNYANNQNNIHDIYRNKMRNAQNYHSENRDVKMPQVDSYHSNASSSLSQFKIKKPFNSKLEMSRQIYQTDASKVSKGYIQSKQTESFNLNAQSSQGSVQRQQNHSILKKQKFIKTRPRMSIENIEQYQMQNRVSVTNESTKNRRNRDKDLQAKESQYETNTVQQRFNNNKSENRIRIRRIENSHMQSINTKGHDSTRSDRDGLAPNVELIHSRANKTLSFVNQNQISKQQSENSRDNIFKFENNQGNQDSSFDSPSKFEESSLHLGASGSASHLYDQQQILSNEKLRMQNRMQRQNSQNLTQTEENNEIQSDDFSESTKGLSDLVQQIVGQGNIENSREHQKMFTNQSIKKQITNSKNQQRRQIYQTNQKSNYANFSNDAYNQSQQSYNLNQKNTGKFEDSQDTQLSFGFENNNSRREQSNAHDGDQFNNAQSTLNESKTIQEQLRAAQQLKQDGAGQQTINVIQQQNNYFVLNIKQQPNQNSNQDPYSRTLMESFPQVNEMHIPNTQSNTQREYNSRDQPVAYNFKTSKKIRKTRMKADQQQQTQFQSNPYQNMFESKKTTNSVNVSDQLVLDNPGPLDASAILVASSLPSDFSRETNGQINPQKKGLKSKKQSVQPIKMSDQIAMYYNDSQATKQRNYFSSKKVSHQSNDKQSMKSLQSKTRNQKKLLESSHSSERFEKNLQHIPSNQSITRWEDHSIQNIKTINHERESAIRPDRSQVNKMNTLSQSKKVSLDKLNTNSLTMLPALTSGRIQSDQDLIQMDISNQSKYLSNQKQSQQREGSLMNQRSQRSQQMEPCGIKMPASNLRSKFELQDGKNNERLAKRNKRLSLNQTEHTIIHIENQRGRNLMTEQSQLTLQQNLPRIATNSSILQRKIPLSGRNSLLIKNE